MKRVLLRCQVALLMSASMFFAQSAVADIALGATPGSVLLLAGLDGSLLRRLIDQVEAGTPRAAHPRNDSQRVRKPAGHRTAEPPPALLSR